MTPQFSNWKAVELIIGEILALKQTFMIKTDTYICIWYMVYVYTLPCLLHTFFIEQSIIYNYNQARWEKMVKWIANIIILFDDYNQSIKKPVKYIFQVHSEFNNKINNKTK